MSFVTFFSSYFEFHSFRAFPPSHLHLRRVSDGFNERQTWMNKEESEDNPHILNRNEKLFLKRLRSEKPKWTRQVEMRRLKGCKSDTNQLRKVLNFRSKFSLEKGQGSFRFEEVLVDEKFDLVKSFRCSERNSFILSITSGWWRFKLQSHHSF
jgi:hypothetical protein